jgi:hypothetical protein
MKREMRLGRVVARLLKACEMRDTGPWVLEGLESFLVAQTQKTWMLVRTEPPSESLIYASTYCKRTQGLVSWMTWIDPLMQQCSP